MDYTQALRGLPIDKRRLDDEVQTHASTYAQVNDEVAKANTLQLRAKDELARTEARLWAGFKDGPTKLTKEEIEGRVTRAPQRIEAWDAYMAARENYERWLGMGESWRQRSYLLTALSNLFSANYFSLTLSSTTEVDERPSWQRDSHALPARRAAETTPADRRPLLRRR